jgi:hypothetical protein
MEKKNLLLSAGFELQTVQHVTSRHTQYVIPATSCNLQDSVSWNPRKRKLYYLCANIKYIFLNTLIKMWAKSSLYMSWKHIREIEV